MRVLLSKTQKGLNIEIRLAPNHSIFMSPENARDLAEDILAILLANAAELEEKTEELQIQAKTAQDESSSPRLTAYPYRLIGVYKIRPTRASVNEAIHYHKQDFLLNEQGEFKERLRRADLEGLVLVETQVMGYFVPDDLDAMSQGDQVPYLEYFLDASGRKILTVKEASETVNPRVCFFLHFADINQPLKMGSQYLTLTPFKRLPKRLKPFTHYLPVD